MISVGLTLSLEVAVPHQVAVPKRPLALALVLGREDLSRSKNTPRVCVNCRLLLIFGTYSLCDVPLKCPEFVKSHTCMLVWAAFI